MLAPCGPDDAERAPGRQSNAMSRTAGPRVAIRERDLSESAARPGGSSRSCRDPRSTAARGGTGWRRSTRPCRARSATAPTPANMGQMSCVEVHREGREQPMVSSPCHTEPGADAERERGRRGEARAPPRARTPLPIASCRSLRTRPRGRAPNSDAARSVSPSARSVRTAAIDSCHLLVELEKRSRAPPRLVLTT